MTLLLPYGITKEIIVSEIYSSADEARTLIPFRHEGRIIIVDPEQLWFWTEDWQAGERQVDEYIQEGNTQIFDSMEEFLRTLRD